MNTIIGYYDEDGFAYCVDHGRSNMEAIVDSENIWETCCICGSFIISIKDIDDNDSE